jgi:hypothetical protein
MSMWMVGSDRISVLYHNEDNVNIEELSAGENVC